MNGYRSQCLIEEFDSDEMEEQEGEEQIFKHFVGPGDKIEFRQTSNDFDSIIEIRKGNTCPGDVSMMGCMDNVI